MQILSLSNGMVFMSADNFSFGAWEAADKVNGKVVHKWKAEDADGNIIGYALDESMASIHGDSEPICAVNTVTALPEDFNIGKYLYIDGEFVLNPDWTEPPKSNEERLDKAESSIEMLTDYSADLLYQVCLLQLGIGEEEL